MLLKLLPSLILFVTLSAFSGASAKETIKQVSSMLVDKTGKQVEIKSKYFPVGHFSEGLITCAKQIEYDFKFGYMDKDGKVIVEPRYSRARPFSCGVGIVEDKIEMNWGAGEYSLVDKSGKVIKYFSREEVEKISDFSNGLAIVRRAPAGVKPHDIDRPESTLTPELIHEKGRWGVCDTKGKLTFFENIGKLHSFSEGLFLVEVDRKFGFADVNGKLVIEPTFYWADSFKEGLAAVALKGKTGFIDKSGKMAFELKFDRVGSFSEGLAPFQTGGRWGFVDTKGKVVIDPQF
ncbi:MAG: WG repeat-containing protein, partial [Candidatus Obscuribacterales bacterium]|nr:WG repeat-containing protein [Candidatus Obscuribacterales bacterium]